MPYLVVTSCAGFPLEAQQLALFEVSHELACIALGICSRDLVLFRDAIDDLGPGILIAKVIFAVHQKRQLHQLDDNGRILSTLDVL